MMYINGLNQQQVTLVCLSHALLQLLVINNSNLSEFCGKVTATELSFFTQCVEVFKKFSSKHLQEIIQ